MTTYVALLRGIMPTNPNMRNEKLKAVFESLGYGNVRTLISSGNVLFESDAKDMPAEEIRIEEALLKQLGIKSPAFVRSHDELKKIIKKNPFKGKEHSQKTYLIASFLKTKPWEMTTIVDTTASTSAKFMTNIDKKYAKEVTTRTWKTVQRIVAKMEAGEK